MNDPIGSAGKARTPSLFHYQDFNPANPVHSERLMDILENIRIFCSDPRSFNDPWDCKPFFDLDALDDPAIMSATAESLISTRIAGPDTPRIDELLRKDASFLKWAMKGFSQRWAAFIPERWGLYCLTSDPCSTLMWSHYSRNHRGICLEFAVNRNKFALAQRVRYQKEYPRLLLFDEESRLSILIVKSDDWEYEKEFRLICPRSTDVKDHPLQLAGSHLPIGRDDLKSIILGCQVDSEAEREISKLVADYAPHVKIRHAVRSPHRYRLILED
jgi:Protein of unknown function (DUF2971)